MGLYLNPTLPPQAKPRGIFRCVGQWNVKECGVKGDVFKCRPKTLEILRGGCRTRREDGGCGKGALGLLPPTLPRAFLLWFVLHIRVWLRRCREESESWHQSQGTWAWALAQPCPAVCDIVQVASVLRTLVFPCLKWWVGVRWCLKVVYSSDILGHFRIKLGWC